MCPLLAAPLQVCSFQGHSFSRNHFKISSWPCDAAAAQMLLFQGHPFSRNHFNISKWPLHAAHVQVNPFQGHPFWCNHFNVSKWPFTAAAQHVFIFQGNPFWCSQFKTSKWPCVAANWHVSASHGSFSSDSLRSHCSTFNWPPFAASLHGNAVPKILCITWWAIFFLSDLIRFIIHTRMPRLPLYDVHRITAIQKYTALPRHCIFVSISLSSLISTLSSLFVIFKRDTDATMASKDVMVGFCCSFSVCKYDLYLSRNKRHTRATNKKFPSPRNDMQLVSTPLGKSVTFIARLILLGLVCSLLWQFVWTEWN